MPQLCLDPARLNATGTFSPVGPRPPALRQFGYYPNTDDWLPGDIILFSAVAPAFSGRMIRTFQERCGYAPEDARWQHAAIYVGQERICEAVTPRVRFQPLHDRVGTHLIRVRRLPGLNTDRRYAVAINALAHLGERYGYGEIFRLLRYGHLFWKKPVTVRAAPFRTICSQLCANAYALGIDVVLAANGTQFAATLADISLTSQLSDVPVHWRAIQ